MIKFSDGSTGDFSNVDDTELYDFDHSIWERVPKNEYLREAGWLSIYLS